MNEGRTFVADLKTTELPDPGERALYDPPVSAQAGARLHALAGDPAADTTPSQVAPATRNIVGFIGVQLVRAYPRPACPPPPDWRNGAKEWLEGLAVVDLRRRDQHRERNPAAVHHHVTFRARLSAIRRVRTCMIASVGGSNARTVYGGASPIDPPGIMEPVEQLVMKPLPDASALPVPQASPAGHSTSAPQLLR